jgi:hypothetical protein
MTPKEVPMIEPIWTVTIAFTEESGKTRADAKLGVGSQSFHGFGRASRAPQDPSVPVIGRELAAARALSDLSHQLLEAGAERIEQFEGHPVKVHA